MKSLSKKDKWEEWILILDGEFGSGIRRVLEEKDVW